MAQLRLTKNELRSQQHKLEQLLKYLPTLQLKKTLLQTQVNETRYQLKELYDELEAQKESIEEYAALLSKKLPVNIMEIVQIKELRRRYENIAGAEVPLFEEVIFSDIPYVLFDTPVWIEGVIDGLRQFSWIRGKISVVDERKRVFKKELHEVSVRVNLFEKILIPRCETNIKKIKIFLEDQFLASIGQAKAAKKKIEKALVAAEEEVL